MNKAAANQNQASGEVENLFQESKNIEKTIATRDTDELVVAMVGPVASGVSTSARFLEKLFDDRFDYKVEHIRISTLIESSAHLVGMSVDGESDKAKRIEILQAAGTALRELFSSSYLAEKAIQKISIDRHKNGGFDELEDGALLAKPRRHVTIIDSLKNPSECELLRQVYGEAMWVFGVFAPEEVREDRLKQAGLSPVDITSILDRDQFEGPKSGQRVRDTIHLADFFVLNDSQNQDDLDEPLSRFLEILFEIGVQTPTLDETAMYAAVSAAASSACMSRQVGASIYSAEGEQIGIGSNDVPKFGGGLYRSEMQKGDHRCFKWKEKLCHNDDRKDKLYSQIFRLLKEEGLLARKADTEKVRSLLAKTDIKNLIEYSRAVHAEMEAIISVGRGNKSGLLGATIYSTTFPCHHCARHIVAAGVNRVVYIEPYAKSLAMDLHSDSISIKKGDVDESVVFQQYEGVAPKNLIRLFRSEKGRKGPEGKVQTVDHKVASPRSATQLDGFDSRELMIVAHIENVEGEG